MKITLSLTLLLLYLSIFINRPEYYIEKQKGYQYKRNRVLDSLRIKDPDFNTIEIQLRIYSVNFNNTPQNSRLTIISKKTNHEWNAKIYTYFWFNESHNNFRNIDTLSLQLNDKWNKIWCEIIKKNYLNLPTESDIKLKQPKNKELFIISDGNYYSIEILTAKRKRKISYNNPEKHLVFLTKHHIISNEFTDFVNFIRLIKRGNVTDMALSK